MGKPLRTVAAIAVAGLEYVVMLAAAGVMDQVRGLVERHVDRELENAPVNA